MPDSVVVAHQGTQDGRIFLGVFTDLPTAKRILMEDGYCSDKAEWRPWHGIGVMTGYKDHAIYLVEVKPDSISL